MDECTCLECNGRGYYMESVRNGEIEVICPVCNGTKMGKCEHCLTLTAPNAEAYHVTRFNVCDRCAPAEIAANE